MFMSFVSQDFFLLYTIVVITHFLLPSRFRWVLLLLASCIFYGAFIPAYLLVLFLIILIDYFAALGIHASVSHKKTWLIGSIAANLLLLSVFKYYDFFAIELRGFTGFGLPLLELALPIGLSFHTFQSLSYTIEVYRGQVEPERNLGIYSLYVMFFPQLVAGPIERPYDLLPQLKHPRPFSSANLYIGLQLMALGFFKKLIIADRLSDYVDAAYQFPEMLNGTQAALSLLFFSIQIYTDFSGYSDIARGTAKTLGYELTLNFNLPYLSSNIAEFWNKWHISLSRWFRDYVYIPMGGNRLGTAKTARNVLITFALSGLWHGAGFNFILWGLINGILVIAYTVFNDRFPSIRLPRFISVSVTFLTVTLVWSVFRAPDIDTAWQVLGKAASIDISHLSDWKLYIETPTLYGNYSIVMTLLCFCGALVLDWKTIKNQLSGRDPFHWTIFTAIILMIIFFGAFNQKSFIYFQF
jgi:hypothetical protein